MNDGAETEVARPRTALREAVLAGQFFGPGNDDAAARLAAFVAAPDADAETLVAWFGARDGVRLARSPDDLRGAIDRDIAALDRRLGAALDAILHHPRLRAFEGRWRGLAWLAAGIDPAARAKLKVLSIAWSEVCRDFERAPEFDQSHLFRKIYEEEYGSPGGEPYGLLVIDHEVRHRADQAHPNDDVSALAAIAAIAAAAFAPTVIAASPALFGVDRFGELAGVVNPAAPFTNAEHARFRGLGRAEDARFLALTLPHVLARAPWRDDPARRDGFRYVEYAPLAEHRVWMAASYAFASIAVRAFLASGWPSDVRGVEPDRAAGGVVDDLPIESFATDPFGIAAPAPLDLALTAPQEQALVDAGLMPLAALPWGQEAVFGSATTVQRPTRFQGPAAAGANANARLSAQFNAMLCVSRFAHYLKMLGRETVGSFRTAGEIERTLQSWLANYINKSTSAGPELRARYPLASGRVLVKERPGRPGVYGCTIHLQPQYQLDDIAATFRLVTDLTAPGPH